MPFGLVMHAADTWRLEVGWIWDRTFDAICGAYDDSQNKHQTLRNRRKLELVTTLTIKKNDVDCEVNFKHAFREIHSCSLN